ncbi:MAG: FliM/FliN family flagellar motor switch protein [Armatimonadia bacterium]
MLVSADLAKEYPIPAAEAPAPAEERALTALAARLHAVVTASLNRFSSLQARVGEVRWELREPEQRSCAIEAWWGQPGLEWVLLMDHAAAETVLAGMLGYGALAPRERLTATDLELLQLPLRDLAGQVQAEFAQPVGAVAIGETRQLPGTECVCLHFEIGIGESTGEGMLLVAWESLRRLYRDAGRESATIDLGALEQAVVRLEAMMPGVDLTLRELLDLQPGDVLQLGALDLQAAVTANGHAFARGKVGAKGERLAVHVTEVATVREDLSW